MGTDADKNNEVIARAQAAHMRYAFTSLQIPEENVTDYRASVLNLLKRCQSAGINLITDVSPDTLSKLGIDSLDELLNLGITYVRLDFGFTAEETVELSKKFHIVFNASTISKDDIAAWQAAGADFSRFAACHNFYPKPLTGLTLARVKEINQRLSYLGFQTMAFIPGDGATRGPLHQGLPTVEEHRNLAGHDLLRAALELREALTDVVLVGDVDLADETWELMGALADDVVPLRAEIEPAFEFVRVHVHHDRPDSSAYIIRSQESRRYAKDVAQLADVCDSLADKNKSRAEGSISMATKDYGRYLGELEIARTSLLPDEKQVVIGHVHEADTDLLAHINQGMGWKFI